MLLSDAWRGFPLIRLLLAVASSKEHDIYPFVVEYYLHVNKVDLLLQSAFQTEIEKISSVELGMHYYLFFSFCLLLFRKYLFFKL